MLRYRSWESVKRDIADRRAAVLAADPPCTRRSDDWVNRSEEWTGDARCTGCGHGILVHPGHGGDTPHCLDCEYRAVYGEPARPWPDPADNGVLLDIIAMMVDQHCFGEDAGDAEVLDSRALTANAAAMRALAAAGRFKIRHQAGPRVIGELTRRPPPT